ncbi:hypothetical protein ACEXQE_06830 [Herbiconiux sp. P17]|uniref:hypothetical protein n=1 Tax=Herbiconiux wuyangfengii TaxID=3342794 RepID=UPI0035B7BA44
MNPITPVTITVARLASMALVGLTAIQDIATALDFDWAVWGERGTGIVVAIAVMMSLIAIIGLAIMALPLWLIRRGSRVTAIAITVIAVWQASLAVAYVDLLGVISALVAVVGAIAIWMPPSRTHLAQVRSERLARRRETVYPQRRK